MGSVRLLAAIARSANTAAIATPTSTATIRSKTTVVTAVIAKIAASERVERSSALALRCSTIRMLVMINTAASAANGICPTSGAAR